MMSYQEAVVVMCLMEGEGMIRFLVMSTAHF